MNDIGEELKRAVRESGKKVPATAKEAGVGYFKLQSFLSGRTMKLDGRMAQHVFRSLTGKDLV